MEKWEKKNLKGTLVPRRVIRGSKSEEKVQGGIECRGGRGVEELSGHVG